MAAQNTLPGASGTKIIVNVYLYKADRNSALFKFQHDLSAGMMEVPAGLSDLFRLGPPQATTITQLSGALAGYTSVGADPSDLDLPSSAVLAALRPYALGRLPYDCWIPRDLGTVVDTKTGIPSVASTALSEDQKSYFGLEDMDTQMKLSWKNLHAADYVSNFKRYLQSRKTALKQGLSELTPTSQELDVYNLTPYLVDYTHTTLLTDFNNSLDVSLMTDPRSLYSYGDVPSPVSSTNLGDVVFRDSVVGSLDEDSIPLIEENDILELRVKYVTTEKPEPPRITESCFVDANGFQRAFIGFITGVSRTFTYGKQESVALQCHGLSKMFHIYDSSFVHSLSTGSSATSSAPVFEEGLEMSNLAFSLWSNQFNNMHSYTIFSHFMSTALFSSSAGLLTERKAELAAKKKEYEAQLTALPKAGTNSAGGAATTSKDKVALVANIKQRETDIAAIEARITGLGQDAIRLLGLLTNPDNSKLTGAVRPPEDLDVQLYTSDLTFDPAKLSFQSINAIPVLMSMARTYASETHGDTTSTAADRDNIRALSGVFGSVEQGYNVPYKLLMQTSFNQFYPELKKPAQIFADMRASTFLELFEDRPGVIRLRPPKYNIMNLNLGIKDFPSLGEQSKFDLVIPGGITEVNGDYVISPQNIASVTITRNDANILTRSDHNWTLPLSNAQVLPGHTGHYTDPAYLSKYGLRTTGPIQHPMALSPTLAAYLSAIALAVRNSGVRSMTLSVMNNKEYQIGRLYYIPVSVPAKKGKDGVVNKGVVGYLTSIKTNYQYNSPPIHVLTLEHVRQAEIIELDITNTTQASPTPFLPAGVLPLVPDIPGRQVAFPGSNLETRSTTTTSVTSRNKVYFANFKRLPDISTYMRLLSTNQKINEDASKAMADQGNDPDADSGNDTYGATDLLTIDNGVGSKLSRRSGGYGDTLNVTGIAIGAQVDSSHYLPEQDIFYTPFQANAFRDVVQATLGVSKNFLAKLTVYGIDPRLKLYPKLSYAYKGVRHVQAPLTESTLNRDTDDVLRVIQLASQQYIAHAVRGSSDTTGYALDSLAGAPAIRTSGAVRHCTDLTTKTIKSHVKGGAAVTLEKCRVVAFTSTGALLSRQDVDITRHMVFCAIHAQWPGGEVRKLLAVHVPYTKSLRLANLINTGVLQNGACRGSATAAKVAKGASTTTPPPAPDAYTAGAAITFSDIDVSLWSLTDIAESCVEIDYGTQSVTPVSSPDVMAQYIHMFEAYTNTVAEPGIVGSSSNVSAAVAAINAHTPDIRAFRDAMPGVYSGVTETSFDDSAQQVQVDEQLNQALTVLHTSTIAPDLAKYFQPTQIAHVAGRRSFASFMAGLETKGKILVPVHSSFFTSYFGAMAKAQQNFVNLPSGNTERSLLVMVSTVEIFDPDKKMATFSPVKGMDNRGEFITSTIDAINIASMEVSYASAQKVKVLGMTGHTTAWDYMRYPRAGNQVRIVTLMDNLQVAKSSSLSPAAVAFSAKERHAVNAHPLAYLWHLSYYNYDTLNMSSRFQVGIADIRTAQARGKLNLLPI